MNIDEAKAIPLTEILSRLDHHPKRINAAKALYSSPLREERTPSFWVYLQPNRWYDYEGAQPQGGDGLNFACAYLKSCRQDHTVSDGLRWLKNMSIQAIAPIYSDHWEEKEVALLLKDKQPIQQLGLILYLKKRGIPLELARKCLSEVHVHNVNTGKSFYALGFENEEGGYELRNPFFKGTLRPKAITFIRGTTFPPKGVHLFEGFMDYLSAIVQSGGQPFTNDVIVLNSLICLRQAIPYLQNYGYRRAYTWLDNDPAGEKATELLAEFFQTQQGLTHQPMNRMYAPHKDVNAWHMHRHNLTL